jgi:hypothetical protein
MPTDVTSRDRPRHRLTSGLAVLAALAAAAAGACLLLAATRTPGYGPADYLSELGATPAPAAALYRLAVLGAALGAALMAGVTRWFRLVSGLLGVSALLFVGSASVTCTAGCPLPPYNPATTARDVFHAAISAGALGFAGLAMLALAVATADPLVGVASRIAGWLMVVLMAATGTALLVQAEGAANGLLERAVVAVALGWLLLVSALVAVRPASASPAAGRPLRG